MKYSLSLIALFVAGTIAIPAATTTKCKADEQFLECGTACPLTCNDPEPRVCIDLCVRGCFCKKGTIRSQSGSCVSRNKCGA
ncbi:trypsin Inhibitor like cysteine rich domain-containing protein [Fusarium mundagurra]|uniref:Trypsin Inhibitor like cysteine rich domain-containing protein n=1 Tax=Fusarium mundagurra TaxID=1567541 RepID=A0A8H5Y9S0_9HYPO|nr:trypsin Inhibitor like cysteine rich domain-containing protein [Fusarium mundagurra]